MNSTSIIDISPLISSDLAVWPDDIPFSRKTSLSLSKGHNVELSSITSTLHLGAHADAPSHFLQGGKSIDNVDLSPYIGKAQVVHVSVGRGERMMPHHFHVPIQASRLLVRTNTYSDPKTFTRDFASFSAQTIDWLHSQGVILVGIDTPSIDLFDDSVLESHKALGKNHMFNLEGLVLTSVPEGLYTLVALPLRISGADGSPVRAVLLKEDLQCR